MDNATKQRIIEFNRRLGLKTEFITVEEGVLGYAENNTIYINEAVEQDFERTNKHEVLHFFENTPEFGELKQVILSSIEGRLDQIRGEYELRYFGIYSEDEIKAGVIDNEIVIDLLVDNSIIEYENGLVVGDRLLGDIEKGLEERRYLNMSIRRNVQNMNLSDWEKIFVENYYDGKEHILPQADKQNGIKREDAIRQDIETYLEQLYAMTEDDFIIDPHSPEVIREYESEIKALQARGEDTSLLEENKEMSLQRIANEYSEHLYVEYRHIVDQIREMEYESSFKALMLRETLTKTYKLDRDDEGRKTIVKKRDMHESIAGHMILNQETLDFIYQHADSLREYGNFANLYFAAIEVYSKSIAQKSCVSLENVDTYGMGQWIKFEGKQSNEEEYLENAERLSSLVQNTPWCTKTLASSQLAEGDFYVFIDNEGEPHIAVRMSGDKIAEVRGVQNGNEQAIENEYREVVLSFLENNQEIEGGIEWLENEEWNNRLIEHRRKIEEGNFTIDDVPILMEDLCHKGYKEHGGVNQNKMQLISVLEETDDIIGIIARYYGCSEDEVYIGDIDFSEFDGSSYEYEEDEQNDNSNGRNVAFKRVRYENLPLIIIGDAYFYGTKEESLEKIKDIITVTGRSFDLADVITSINDPEYTKSCIERSQELGFEAYQIYNLIKIVNDPEYTKSCIERSQELGFEAYQIYNFIKIVNDPEYTKSCIERSKELGLEAYQICNLITSINDPEYTRRYIERSKEFGFKADDIYDLITSINDPEYTKSCIERSQELGFEAYQIYNLIKIVNDPEYTKSCIERSQELGFEAYQIYNLIKIVNDPEYTKSCIERSQELGFEAYQIYNLITSINDPEYTKSCIERSQEFGFKADDIYDLITSLHDSEYEKDCIKRGLIKIGDLVYSQRRQSALRCMRECIAQRDLSPKDKADLIISVEDPEYTKACINRWIDDIGIISYIEDDEEGDYYYDDESLIRLIKSLRNPEYIKSCIERREELDLLDEQVEDLEAFIAQLEKDRNETHDASEIAEAVDEVTLDDHEAIVAETRDEMQTPAQEIVNNEPKHDDSEGQDL